MSNQSSPEQYSLSPQKQRDIVDSLKLDLSPATAFKEKDNQAKKLFEQSLMFLAGRYWHFMPERTLNRIFQLSDNFVLTANNEQFAAFLGAWQGLKDEVNPDRTIATGGVTLRRGYNIFVSNNPQDMLEQIKQDPKKILEFLSPSALETVKELLGDNYEEILINYYQQADESEFVKIINFLYEDIISHEAVHLCEPLLTTTLKRPVALSELGGYFYTNEVMESFHPGFVDQPLLVTFKQLNEARIRFYQSLIDEFGNDIHRLYFGKSIKKAKKEAILKKISAAPKDLLPQVYQQ